MTHKAVNAGWMAALRPMSFAAVLMLSVITTRAGAAPVLPADANGLPSLEAPAGALLSGSKTLGIIDRATITGVPNQSKTIEMLLEMQGKNPGLEGGERRRQEMPAGGRASPGPQTARPTQPFGAQDPANPFGGAGLLPNKARVAPQDAAVDWTEVPASRFGGGVFSSSGTPQRDNSGRTTHAGRASEDDDLRWLIPRPVVRFVRQNRELVVVGSVVVLLLLWGATAITSGRRK